MTPPSTPLKKQHINPAPVASSLATPASGRVYDVSESPSKRHEQSPKFIYKIRCHFIELGQHLLKVKYLVVEKREIQ